MSLVYTLGFYCLPIFIPSIWLCLFTQTAKDTRNLSELGISTIRPKSAATPPFLDIFSFMIFLTLTIMCLLFSASTNQMGAHVEELILSAVFNTKSPNAGAMLLYEVIASIC